MPYNNYGKTVDEILALEASTRGTSGMTAEEADRRLRSIHAQIQAGNLDNAYDGAKGPYRINEGQPTAQQSWSRNPGDANSYSDTVRSGSSPTPSTTGPVMPGSPPPMRPPADVNRGPYQNPPQYGQDMYQSPGSGGTPNISIHVNGTQPSTYPGYPSPQSQGVPQAYPPGTGIGGDMPPSWQQQAYQQNPPQNPLEWGTSGPTGAMGVWPGYTDQQAQKDYFMQQRMNQINPPQPQGPQFGQPQGPTQQMGMPSFQQPPPPFNNSLNGYQGGVQSWNPIYGGAPQQQPQAQVQPPYMGWGNLSR